GPSCLLSREGAYTMTIAIIGAGNMARGLAKRLAAAGEEVALAARDERKTEETARAISGKVKAIPPSAPGAAEVIVLALPYSQAAPVLNELGDLTGKVIVDITNAIGPNFAMAVAGGTSAAEEIQKQVGKGSVVKAFNTLFARLLDPMPGKAPPQI